jgi:hypothetical protein
LPSSAARAVAKGIGSTTISRKSSGRVRWRRARTRVRPRGKMRSTRAPTRPTPA